MSLYYVRLTTDICGEVEAETEQNAIEQLTDSMKNDKYEKEEFEVVEIEKAGG